MLKFFKKYGAKILIAVLKKFVPKHTVVGKLTEIIDEIK